MCLMGTQTTAVAQDDDEDYQPGLLAKYSVDDHSAERIDNVLSFHWGADAPDQRLPTGAFSATWSGNLLARVPGKHRFHAFVAGDVSISIDDQPVLTASRQWAFVSGEEVALSPGDHKIRVTYSTPKNSDKSRAKVSLFWSSDAFTLEPIPADALFREKSSPASVDAYGRKLADANRCAACHQTDSDRPVVKAPALDRLRGSQPMETLIERLIDPQLVVANSHMPNFGMNKSEAESVAAFLVSVSKDAQKDSEVKIEHDAVAAGTKLLNSLGCVACHQVPGMQANDLPLAAPYDGPELVNVGKRRPAVWLERWLRDPGSLNGDHRMPVFALSKDERRQLVAALMDGHASTVKAVGVLSADVEQIAVGKALVTSANCAACHAIPGVKASTVSALTKVSFEDNGSHCFRPHGANKPHESAGKRVPFFSMLGSRADAVMDWYSTVEHHSSLDLSANGELLLQRNGCIACHDRNLGRGLSTIARKLQNSHPDLRGQSQSLVPPSLTAVGDKLTDEYLAKAVAGEQTERRLPWLLVRMPKFQHSMAERAAITHHLVTTDRIPDEADKARTDILDYLRLSNPRKVETADLVLGNHLTGAGGFNCVACHKAGPFEPRNVAPGTRGSDIMTMGRQLRERYFLRWMKNPIRVVSGIEMPAIQKAMPDVLDGSLPKQMNAIWNALSDERFTPPTVTSRFEQVVNVEPGGQPRVIRDVFTIGVDKDRDAVARAMAIGFGNGHNILVDLDTMQVRLWTIGEFARQRTEGKSWYWDMPGMVLWKPKVNGGPHHFHRNGVAENVHPVIDEGRSSEVLSYRIYDQGVEVICRSWFDPTGETSDDKDSTEPHFVETEWQRRADQLVPVVLKHSFEMADPAGSETRPKIGWTHTLKVVETPDDWHIDSPVPDLLSNRPREVEYSSSGIGPQIKGQDCEQQWKRKYIATLATPSARALIPKKLIVADTDGITTTPGFDGTRLPIDKSIMPTSITWLKDGRMAFTSLKGHVWIAEDTDGDGLPDKTTLFEEGLAAPFGILAEDNAIVVAHKPEILRLRDTDGDGHADEREVVGSGWGYSDNYHDWASGLIRDPQGNMYVGLGSDYSQKERLASQDRWRGGVIKIDPSGIVTPLAMSMRYPMSLAFDGHGNLFATDNQGVQNTFNEINHILPGTHYGVPSRHQPTENLKPESPALAVPHPWTRSMNSILFLPDDFSVVGLRGHGIGCEYDSRFLIRFTVQDVDGTLQGASYYFSRPNQEAGGRNFIGPICSAVAPDGAIVIGSIWDSGWQGGQNNGGITRLVPTEEGLPNGIRELTATASGFEIEFFKPVDVDAAADETSWSLQAYTREWGGGYATPDSGRHNVTPDRIQVLDGGKRVRLFVKDLKPGYLYEVSVDGALAKSEELWPAVGHYSMKVVPQ